MDKSPCWRLHGAALCLLLLPLCALLLARAPSADSPRAPDTCLGASILSEAAYAALIPAQDAGDTLLFNGQLAAFDRESATFYLPVRIPEDARPADLTGTLSVLNGAARLAFAPDAAFDNLNDAVADGYAFTLLMIKDGGRAATYSAVFTPLPVLSVVSDDPDGYDDPYAEHTGRILVHEPGGAAQASLARWHRRGMTTRLYKKGSWKLSLQNAFGHGRNLAFAGLGADDDWILNSMSMDDLKLREKLIQDLYNGAATREGRARMSAGAYAEVVFDGQYMGLYLLQRRVDAKYLALDRSRAVLLKGSNVAQVRSAADAFTIRSSPYDEAATLALAEPLYTLDDPSVIDLDSWLDMDVFVLFAGLYDNLDTRNAYYILLPEGDVYAASFLLWDTDVAFGMAYVRGAGYRLMPDTPEGRPLRHRREYDALRSLYPDLDARLAGRWRQLRAGALSDETISGTLDGLLDQLLGSGAWARDQQLWGTRQKGADTFEGLQLYIRKRLDQLDQAYAAP